MPAPSAVVADLALHRAQRTVARDAKFVAVEGRAIHCRVGRLVGYGTGVKVIKHDTCGIGGCGCECHWGGKP